MKTKKQRIVNFDGKWRPGWLFGDGVWGPRRLNILPYIIDLLGPFREIWEYARKLSGNSQEKKCARVWKPSSFPLVPFYGARTVLSVLQLVSHIYSIKPNSCWNNPAKSFLWMHLHQFQYLLKHISHAHITEAEPIWLFKKNVNYKYLMECRILIRFYKSYVVWVNHIRQEDVKYTKGKCVR